jgi:hypothetical protein
MKIYPDTTWENQQTTRPTLFWQIRGPKDTLIKWICCYYSHDDHCFYLVQTTTAGNLVFRQTPTPAEQS